MTVEGAPELRFAPPRVTVEPHRDGSTRVRSPLALEPSARCVTSWLLDWANAYPRAQTWVTPGIPAKLTELKNYKAIVDGLWAEDFLSASMQDVPLFDETVFYHRRSRSLIVTDLVQNREERGGVFIAPPLNQSAVIKNTDAFKSFIAQIAAWDFDRIVITHGDIIETSARQAFERITAPFT